MGTVNLLVGIHNIELLIILSFIIMTSIIVEFSLSKIGLFKLINLVLICVLGYDTFQFRSAFRNFALSQLLHRI